MNMNQFHKQSNWFTIQLLLVSIILTSLKQSAQTQAQPQTKRVISFTDISKSANFPTLSSLKYGGAVIADIDGDSLPDIIFPRHNSHPPSIYFNEGGLKFRRLSTWNIKGDIHAITPVRYSPRRKQLHLIVSPGGSNGNNLLTPRVFKVNANRQIVELARPSDRARGRGRTAIFMNLKSTSRGKVISKRPDVIFTSVFHNQFPRHQSAFELKFYKVKQEVFKFKNLSSQFATDKNVYGLPVDIDNDGVMELVSFHWFRIYKIIDSDFNLVDITKSKLPTVGKFKEWRGTIGVCEFDFNNDGRWDMVLSRSKGQNLHWLANNKNIEIIDRLLVSNANTNKFDVIQFDPTDTDFSRGITTGDFNNDGFEDILISKFNRPDKLYININGTGKFTILNGNDIGLGDFTGDDVSAVDLDQDGRLDVVVSQGDWLDRSNMGIFRLLKISDSIPVGNYLLVRVGSSQMFKVSSLHAVVQLQCDDLSIRRRVGGGNIGTSVSISLVETVHFGVANCKVAKQITVTWINGQTVTRKNVRTNRLISIGRFS